MYDFIDRPVTSLDHGGRLLVWAMRNWVKAAQSRQCPCRTLGAAFAKWKLGEGMATFHRMMLIFNSQSTESFGFGTLGCQRIQEHEALILGLVHAAPLSSAEHLRVTLGLVVDETAVDPLMDVITELGRAMANAGIFPGKPRLHPATEDRG
jgi:hypothetical protein